MSAAFGPGEVLLPFQATARDLAERRAGHNEFALSNAGLAELASRSRERQAKTVEKAAREMEWLGVTPD